MKKKLVIANIITIFFSLLTLLLVSSSVVKSVNEDNIKNELNNYLHIATNIFNGENSNEVLNYFSSNTKIRLTIIDFDGNIIVDNEGVQQNDNHLNRPEIQNLNKVYYRYSNSLKCRMVYLATKDDNYYVRIAMPETNVNNINSQLITMDLIAFIIIIFISSFISKRIVESSSRPLKTEISKLSKIVGKDVPLNNGDIEILSSQINDVQILIQEKIYNIEIERNKIEYIIDNMSQGFILFDEKLNISLINNKAMELFSINQKNLNYLYFIRDINLQKAIENCLNSKINSDYNITINESSYHININLFTYKEGFNEIKGVTLFIYDVTQEIKDKEMKQNFFQNASHELKSPLTTIIGYQQMIEQGILQDENELKEANQKTLKAAKRMNQLVIDMLELSSLENSSNEKYDDCSIKETILNILDSFELRLKEKSIKPILSLEDFSVSLPQEDLIKLLKNLIENSIKYNINHGEIIITTSKENQAFTIKDTGIGIAKENQEKIFERFYQVNKLSSFENNGTGLGLAIVKHVCLKYNIKLKLTSELNKGTEITLLFK